MLFNLLNKLNSKGDINATITYFSNELLETLKIIKTCTSCKKDYIKEKGFDELHELINELELKKEIEELSS